MRALYRFFFLVGICAVLIMLPHESCSCGDDDEDNANPSIDDDGNDDADCEDHPMCGGHPQGYSCVDNVMVICWPGDDGCLDLTSAVNCNFGGTNLVCVDAECVEPGDDDDDDDCEDNPLCPATMGWICLENWLIFCEPGSDGCLDIVNAGDCGEYGQVCVGNECRDSYAE